MTKTSGLAQLLERRRLAFNNVVCWPTTTLSWMLASFLIAIAAVGVAFFGKGSGRLGLALMWTGRWSFLLFWLAYVGSGRTIALECIALAFAEDFIFIPLHGGYSRSKLLFALMLVSGVILRVAAVVRRMAAKLREPSASNFSPNRKPQ
jgi:hypothetical protein